VVTFQHQRDTGAHQSDHQHLVVDAADQVDQHQGVEHGQPQRDRRLAAQMFGQIWHRPHHQRESGQHDQSQRDGARDHVVAGDGGDGPAEQQEDRAVGRGGGGPDRADIVQQHAGIGDGADPVGIETVAQQRALRQIGVGVAAEHGHREQQREDPDADDRPQLVQGHPRARTVAESDGGAPEANPRGDHQQYADPDHHGREGVAVAEAQPRQVHRLQQRVAFADAARAEAAEGDHHRAEETQQRRVALRTPDEIGVGLHACAQRGGAYGGFGLRSGVARTCRAFGGAGIRGWHMVSVPPVRSAVATASELGRRSV